MRVATAKIRTFSFIFQIFPEVFFILFFVDRISLDCGCKGRWFLFIDQMFLQLFLKYFCHLLFLIGKQYVTIWFFFLMFFASNLAPIPPMGVRYFWLDPKVTKRSRLTLLAYSVHCVRCARLKPFAPLTSTALRTLSPFSPFYGHQRMPGFSSVLPSLLLPHRLPLRLAFLLLCLRFLELLRFVVV